MENMMFPVIECLDDLLPHIKNKPEIRVDHQSNGMTVVCYMVSAENTFDSAWTRECRGITFGPDGKIAGRSLHKFFNVNEREETRPENLPSNIVRLMDKRDGSMIHTVKVGDTFRLKSKKSFDSDVAKAATEWINRPENANFYRFCEVMAWNDETAIFEFTAPDARIVLPYKNAELKLLHVRDNKTGEYWNRDYMHGIFGKGNCVEEFNCEFITLQMLLDQAKTVENIEGWIAQFPNEMVKVKCDWYLKRHRAMTFLRERDIAQLVLDEGLDDIKSMLVGDGVNIADILAIENKVAQQIVEMELRVKDILYWDSTMDRKSFAIKHQGTPHFGLLMAAYTGKEPNYKDYFEKNILKQEYSLRQLALMDTTAEAE